MPAYITQCLIFFGSFLSKNRFSQLAGHDHQSGGLAL